MKESAIQRAILEYLAVKGILAFRMNAGAMKVEYNGKSRFMRFGVAGMADILAFKLYGAGIECRTGVIWIEVKTAIGKQSELQKSFQHQVERYGHRYILARSVDDVEAAFDE